MKLLKDNKGSAILWTILLSVIITILLGAVMTASYAYFNYTMYTVKRQQAYFTARSGVEVIVNELSTQDEEHSSPLLPKNKGEVVNISDISFDSKMGEIKEATITRNEDEDIRLDVSVTATYADQDYTITCTVFKQPLYFAGVAIKNLTLNGGNLNLGKNTDLYWNNTNVYNSKNNGYFINIQGNLVTKGDAIIYPGTTVANRKFNKTVKFSKTGKSDRRIWSSEEYILSNKTLKVFEKGTPEYSSSWFNTLKTMTSTNYKYCNNSAVFRDRHFGFPGLLALLGDAFGNSGLSEEALFNALGLGDVYTDLRNSSLSISDSSTDALAIRYIKVLSVSALMSERLQAIIDNRPWWDVFGISSAIAKALKGPVDNMGLKTLDLSYIDYDSTNQNSWSDTVVPVVYLLVGEETALSGTDMYIRVQYGKNPANMSSIGQITDKINSSIDDFLSQYLKITKNLAYVVVYLGKGCTLELGTPIGTNPTQRNTENLIFAYSVYGSDDSTLILNDGVKVLGEIQVDNLIINGNADVIYSTSNGSQVAKQRVAEFWTVVNYTEE